MRDEDMADNYVPDNFMHTEWSVQNPSVKHYSVRGLRVALVGGPAVGKNHVCTKLDDMQTSDINLLLHNHPSIPRHQFRDDLNELKRLIFLTQEGPDPCDHVYVVWYFASDRWERVDAIFVSELSALCNVIVVIAKGDLRSSRLDPVTGKTEAQQLEEAIRVQFRNVTIVHCSDPTLNPAFWVPPVCKFGHDRSNFRIQPEEETWACMCETKGDDGNPVICRESHTGTYGPTGYDELFRESLALIPELCARSIRRVKENKRRMERGNMWLMVAVGLALFAVAVKIGTSMFSASNDSRQTEPVKRLAKL